MMRVTMAEKEQAACPVCLAQVGAPCETANGVPWEWYPSWRSRHHPERREAFLRIKARTEWMRTHPGECPCESELDGPGEHIEACRWHDPNHDEGI